MPLRPRLSHLLSALAAGDPMLARRPPETARTPAEHTTRRSGK